MTFVWLLIYEPSPYEPFVPCGIFSTEAKAQAAKDDHAWPSDCYIEEWPLDENRGETKADRKAAEEAAEKSNTLANLATLTPEEEAKMQEMRRDFHESMNYMIWGIPRK